MDRIFSVLIVVICLGSLCILTRCHEDKQNTNLLKKQKVICT